MAKRSPFLSSTPEFVEGEKQEKELKKTYTNTVLVLGIGFLIVFNVVSGLLTNLQTSRAIAAAKSGALGSTIEQQVSDVARRLEISGSDASSSLNTRYGAADKRNYYVSQLEDYNYSHGYEKKPDYLTPEIRVGVVKWEAKTRTGDGENTPKNFVWVKGTVHVEAWRKKRFDDSKIKLYDEDVVFGPVLIDFDHKIYTYTSSNGSGYEDFWNMDIPIDTWKKLPDGV